MKDKRVIEYLKKYNIIPKDFCERFEFLIKFLKLSLKDIEEVQRRIKNFCNMKWSRVGFTIYLEPAATPRPRMVFKSRRTYVPNAKNNNDLFKEFKDTCMNDIEPIVTPCCINIKAYFPIPNTMTKVEKVLAELGFIPHISKPDWDNLGKTYSDMIQPHILVDDSLIYESKVTKLYSFKPRIEIDIKYMNKFDCKFNRKKVESWKTIQEYKELINNRMEE